MTHRPMTPFEAMHAWADTSPDMRGLVLVYLADARAMRAKSAEAYLGSECADVAACGERQRMAVDALDAASVLLQVASSPVVQELMRTEKP